MALVQVLAWLGVLGVLWAGAIPAVAAVVPEWPDRGVALALPAGLLVFGVVVFWVGHVSMTVAVPLGALAVFGMGLVGRRAGGRIPRSALRWPLAVFLAAFGLLIAVRFVDPAVTPSGGEKFLDFGLLQSVLRAGRLPPEDPWFAGRPVRYYYGGYLLVGGLTRLSGVDPAVAYNLAVATAYATLATAVYGVAGATVPEHPRTAGWLGTGFVAAAGHLATPGRALLGLLPRSLAEHARPLYLGYRTTPAEGLDLARRVTTGWYSYWNARHVVPGVPTAFPMWTFVNGDLRPHMIGAPFLVLVVAVCLAIYRTPPDHERRRRLLAFGVAPVVAGVVLVTNSWDFPTALGLVWLTLVHAPGRPTALLWATPPTPDPPGIAARVARELRRVVEAAAVTAVVALLALAVAAPFFLVPAPVNRGIGIVPDRMGIWQMVLVYGGFLVPFGLALAWRFGQLRGRSRAVPVAAGLVVVALSAFDLAAVAIVGLCLLAGWTTLSRRRSAGGAAFDWVLLVAGAGLVVITELVYLRVWPYHPAVLRWNTAYKVSMQLWLVWGIGAGAALTRVLATVRERNAPDLRPAARATAVVAVVVLVGVAAFPTFALVAHFEDPGEHPAPAFTLDARRHAETNRSAEVAAADWLADRPGRATIASRPGTEPYQWRNVPSALTGVPTVVGWVHEAGYRGIETYRRRVRDVRRIYTGHPTRARLLAAAYDVEYVYLGPAERTEYRVRNPGRIPGVGVAYANARVVVYAVDACSGVSTTAAHPAGGSAGRSASCHRRG